ALRHLAGGPPVSLSFCFSADCTNLMCRDLAFTCSSVRGNLYNAYRDDYGWPGLPLAGLHLLLQRWFHLSLAMTDAMAGQVRRASGARPIIVPNFIDEAFLE